MFVFSAYAHFEVHAELAWVHRWSHGDSDSVIHIVVSFEQVVTVEAREHGVEG